MNLVRSNIPRLTRVSNSRLLFNQARFQSSNPQKWDRTKILSKLIEVVGPIPLSQYMQHCLTSDWGYYTKQQPFGEKGDFVTSPEISQMFGELIGVWFFSIWLNQNRSSSINFIELGPGNGTLLADCLKSFNRLLKAHPVKQDIFLVERSKKLRRVQHAKLCGEFELSDPSDDFWHSKHHYNGNITWVDTELDIKDIAYESNTSNFVIAHEFFDVLPIRKFIKKEEGWREFLVDFNPESNKLFLTQAKEETLSSHLPSAKPRYEKLPVDSIVEISPFLEQYSKTIIELVGSSITNSGAALIVDYGPSDETPSNSLRGIKDHKFVNPFENPGQVDLSIDVDFQEIKEIVNQSEKTEALGPIEQGDWLLQLGIQQRAHQLFSSCETEEEKQNVVQSFNRLVSKDDKSMGKIYKFLGIVPKGTKAFGFEK